MLGGIGHCHWAVGPTEDAAMDAAMDFIKQNLSVITGVAGAALVLWLLVRFLSPRKDVIPDVQKVNVLCRKCKWQGIVTKYNLTCRKCAGKDLEVL